MEKEAAVNRASFSVGEKGVPMQLQKLLSLIRQAVDRYNMIAEGDKIAVGVSGGKDSLTLLYALKKLSQFYPKHFTVCAICVDLGYDNTDFTGIDEFCRNLDVPLTLISTQIGKIVMEGEQSLLFMREASKGSVGGRGCPAWLHPDCLCASQR